MEYATGRREFLRRAGLLIPAMHFPGWAPQPPARPLASPAARTVEFLRLRLRTSHLEEQRDFYRDRLGLPIVAETHDFVTIRAGNTELQFVHSEVAGHPYYHFAFNIPENKLDAAITWMRSRAPLVQRRGTDGPIFHFAHWNAHAIYFFDPAGNIVEFIARHTLPNSAAGAFDVPDILYASEIGLVVPEVPQAVAALKGRLGIEEYVGVSNVFAPVGNEYGLFIVVQTGRTWFGTENLAAAVFPAEVRLRGAAAGQHAIPAGSFHIEVAS